MILLSAKGGRFVFVPMTWYIDLYQLPHFGIDYAKLVDDQ